MELRIAEIMRILPHRHPFLLVDRVIEVDPDKRIVALKNVSINEPFFNGHFPGTPVMPGVLTIESMAQAGAILGLLEKNADLSKTLVYFMGIDEAKFRRPIVPGDQMRIVVEVIRRKASVWKMKGEVWVGGELDSSHGHRQSRSPDGFRHFHWAVLSHRGPGSNRARLPIRFPRSRRRSDDDR